MSTVAEPKTKTVIQPFGVEIDTCRNGDMIIQSIPGCRMRGAIRQAKPIKDEKTGEFFFTKSQALTLGRMPQIPGMRIHVNPAKCAYQIVDPLYEDEDLCERIRIAVNRINEVKQGGKLKGVSPKSGKLDVHRMKTLCRELVWIVEAGDGNIVKGTKPELKDLGDLPGHFLLNPGSRIQNSQPTFEKDYDRWYEAMTRAGG